MTFRTLMPRCKGSRTGSKISRHARESGHPGRASSTRFWTPAWAEVTILFSNLRSVALAAVAIAGALSATSLGAAAQEGNIAAGHAFASEACKPCHVVDVQEKSPRNLVIAPAFRDIANTPGMTATALRVFLTSSHPKMPNLILKPQQIGDVIAYILSLRDHP
jgi:cytochrome c